MNSEHFRQAEDRNSYAIKTYCKVYGSQATPPERIGKLTEEQANTLRDTYCESYLRGALGPEEFARLYSCDFSKAD